MRSDHREGRPFKLAGLSVYLQGTTLWLSRLAFNVARLPVHLERRPWELARLLPHLASRTLRVERPPRLVEMLHA